MIKSITSSSLPWLNVNQYQNPPYISPGSQSSGMVRYNPSLSRLEVYDGNTWLELGSNVSVELSASAREILEWAQKKIEEERTWRAMAENNPAIRDAYEKFKKAEEQLRIVDSLTKNTDNALVK